MSSKKGKKKKNTHNNIGDVTINDFANATVLKNRMKKSNPTNVLKQVDERNWDEKIDDFLDFDFIETENEDGTTSMVIKKREKPRQKSESVRENNEIYYQHKNYPLDIWFLIGEYIRPEDVGKFALICKNSWTVTCSAKFWFGLYKKYYQGVKGLPERLQPESMVRLYGLRACVIRALNYFYAPFSLKSAKNLYEHPSCLVKRICVTAWVEKISKTNWIYRWKLRDISETNIHPSSEKSKPDLIEMLQDIFANSESNCKILQLSCPNFVQVPPVMGHKLISAKIQLSNGFKSHRVVLKFSIGSSDCVEIVLDPVCNVSVLDWWNPKYPHSILNTPCLENEQN